MASKHASAFDWGRAIAILAALGMAASIAIPLFILEWGALAAIASLYAYSLAICGIMLFACVLEWKQAQLYPDRDYAGFFCYFPGNSTR